METKAAALRSTHREMHAKKSPNASIARDEREREMKRETKLTLEQYLHFYEDPWRSNISRTHLNQIIVMHGFVKLHNFPKVLIQEYLGSIELIPPTRSTLDEGISCGALLTAAEVAEDLASLGWQECTVRSLRTLKPAAELEHLTAFGAEFPFIPASYTIDHLPSPQPRPLRRRRRPARAPPADFVIMGRRPRSKRKRVSINALTAADMFATSSRPTALSIPPPPLSPPPPPPPASPPPSTPSSTPPVTPPPPSSPPPW